MAIKKLFGGANLRKPAAYSRYLVDNSGGSPLEANDALFIIGEAKSGKPGSSDGVQEFSIAQIKDLIDKYESGPIVDAAIAAKTPSSSSLIGGAGKLYVYKTNASTQASVYLDDTAVNDLINIKDRLWGASGNNINVTVANGTAPATQKIITIAKLGETSEVMPQNEGRVELTVYYYSGAGSSATATLTIAGASKAAKTLTTTLSGAQSDGSVALSIPLATYTMKTLVDKINTYTGYTAVLSDVQTGTVIGATDLDLVSALDIKGSGAAKSLYRLQEEIIDVINENSAYVEASLHATPRAGLPVNVANAALTGGAQGASTDATFSAGLAKSLTKEYRVAIPLISQDYTSDIALGQIYDGGFVTDAGSTYTIAGVSAALKSHLLLRAQIKSKKEALGAMGYRVATKAAAEAASAAMASEMIQFFMQDVKIVDAEGSLRWKQPHIKAVMVSAMRCGSDFGEPMTHKYLNVFDMGHDIDMAGDESEDGNMNPDTDFDELIDAGICFSEKVSGGWRIVCDNTTYGADQSFVFNRASVMDAVFFISKTLRNTAELMIGSKISNGAASSIKTILRDKLIELNKGNYTTASTGAPQGFREDEFVVTITGNTAEVSVPVCPCQGLDFVLITFTLLDIKQSA